jgi:hypothetical protein
MHLRTLFGIHAVLTFAAGAVLVTAPGAIPSMVGITIDEGAYLLCYLLAATEFAMSVLSWGARRITDLRALRIVVITFIVMHGTSAALEIHAFTGGLSGAIWGNVAVRVLAVALFGYYGLISPRTE